jgi:LPPG:FO 2-phospho-L-lactate transferase
VSLDPTELGRTAGPIVALAGGVGAARLLRGLVQVVPPEDVVAVVNTGDDCEFYGVHVSPDVDIVTYTLAGVVNSKLGFGLEGDRFDLVERLAELGHASWFRLGDRDFANCLHRTLRLRAGAGLAQVTDELRRAHDLATRIVPMSEDPCPTRVALDDGSVVHFEEYLVRDGAPDAVRNVDLSAAERATPAPGVLEAIAAARVIVVCPSNPVVSIGPILALPGVREAVKASAAPVVAVSPIVGGAAIKGPAAQLLRGTGCEVSARGVADLYRDWVDGMVIDRRDAALAGDLSSCGVRPAVADTMMIDPRASARVAQAAMDLAAELAIERLADPKAGAAR